jgi:hypothetical protein
MNGQLIDVRMSTAVVLNFFMLPAHLSPKRKLVALKKIFIKEILTKIFSFFLPSKVAKVKTKKIHGTPVEKHWSMVQL